MLLLTLANAFPMHKYSLKSMNPKPLNLATIGRTRNLCHRPLCCFLLLIWIQGPPRALWRDSRTKKEENRDAADEDEEEDDAFEICWNL